MLGIGFRCVCQGGSGRARANKRDTESDTEIERERQRVLATGEYVGRSNRHRRRESVWEQRKQPSGAWVMLVPANRRYLKAKSDASLSCGAP